MALKMDEKEDVFTRLYGQDTCTAATRKRQPSAPKHNRAMRSAKSCPMLDAAVAAMSLSALPCPQATLDGDPNDPHTLLRDNANFAKFCRECPDLVGGSPRFSTVDIDLIFVKVKAKGARRISYPMFLEALGIIATKKYPAMGLTSALPTLLDAHIAKLSCLDSARSPGKSTWRRRVAGTEANDVTAMIDIKHETAVHSVRTSDVLTADLPQHHHRRVLKDQVDGGNNQQIDGEVIPPPPPPIVAKHTAESRVVIATNL
ncbi:hypothetical protein, variant 1 [Aphanomyces astaci]|uniref:Uncharacterized protein n=3 Tax=Aphanomyces astaci TaxID=112090 RepID=W4H0F6_APHAT|nr:hypothetical protein, variant 1 [Aphanomyces astaci]ETV85397.1 hypothetical protein, variant 1 [Aphanomyces astaci]|eukprot:XP_009825417.1 hypothetical protein, variant 1 [Aphanomyces astaci]